MKRVQYRIKTSLLATSAVATIFSLTLAGCGTPTSAANPLDQVAESSASGAASPKLADEQIIKDTKVNSTKDAVALMNPNAPSQQTQKEPEPSLGEPAPGPAITDRKPNEMGDVFVPMFHHLGPGHGNLGIQSLYCTPKQFVKFLTELDELGFRPVTANEYLTGKMHLPPGATPVVMTFDDSNPDQLQMDKDGNVKPNCFVGLWMKFAETHPEFPVHGTFFVLPHEMFGQHSLWPKKEALLKKLGSEMANHTMTHPFLSHLSDDQVKYQIGDAALRLYKLGMPNPSPLALPYGVSPRNHQLYYGFTYKGQKIHLSGVFLVGSAPAYSPFSKRFNRFHINRIDGSTTPLGLQFWLDRVRHHKVNLYVQGP